VELHVEMKSLENTLKPCHNRCVPKVDWSKVRPYPFEEFWQHLQYSSQFMNYEHVSYGGKILDMPKPEGRPGSMPWLYGEYLRDIGIEGIDRSYRVSAYCSILDYVGWHVDLFKRKKLMLPSPDGDRNHSMMSQDLMRAVHFFVTNYADHGHMGTEVVNPNHVIKLATAYSEARARLSEAKERTK
jgi:hypothetical protein